MSTAITTAYDNLVSRVAAVLTSGNGWLQIPNGWDVPSNAKGFLRQGYGLAIGAGVNAKLQLSLKLSVERKFTLSIAREVFKTDGDADGYATVAKQLFEDLKLVIKDFETNTTLNGGQIFCSYVSDTGIQPIESQDFSGMFVQSDFSVILIEDLNS
jgi:hypothetical protein